MMKAPIVLTIGNDDAEHALIRESWRLFDAAACQCHDEADKRRIFSIIERCPGGVHAFNHHVKLLTSEMWGSAQRISAFLTLPSLSSVPEATISVTITGVPSVDDGADTSVDMQEFDSTEPRFRSKGSEKSPRESENLLAVDMRGRGSGAKGRSKRKQSKLKPRSPRIAQRAHGSGHAAHEQPFSKSSTVPAVTMGVVSLVKGRRTQRNQ